MADIFTAPGESTDVGVAAPYMLGAYHPAIDKPRQASGFGLSYPWASGPGLPRYAEYGVSVAPKSDAELVWDIISAVVPPVEVINYNFEGLVGPQGPPGPPGLPGVGGTGIPGPVGSSGVADMAQPTWTGSIQFTDNSPSAGYVAWTTGVLRYKGAAYTITAGNSNKNFIYWDLASPTAFQGSDTRADAVGADKFIIARNASGTATVIMAGKLVAGQLLQDLSVDSGALAAAAVIAEKLNVLGLDALGKLVLAQIGSGDSDDISEGSTNMWAAEHGADITGDHTAADTALISGYPADLMAALYRSFQEYFEDPNSDVATRWPDVDGGSAEQSIQTGGLTGGKFWRVGDNSGNDQRWAVFYQSIPFDETKLYRIRCRIRRTAGSGSCYLGIQGRNGADTEWVSTAGANTYAQGHWICAAGSTPGSSWVIYTGYLKGHAASGTGTACPNPGSPGQLHDDARYFRPVILVNFSDVAGTFEIDEFSIDIMPEDADQIADGSSYAVVPLAWKHTSDLTKFDGGVIYSGTIIAAAIAAGAILTDHLGANQVTAAKIAVGTITANELATGAVTADEIAANAVYTAALQAGAVTAAKIAAGTITANEIAALTITAAKIQADAIETAKINNLAVATAKIADDATEIYESVVTAGSYTLSNSGTEYEVQSDSISSDGGFVEIACSVTLTNSDLGSSFEVSLYIDVGATRIASYGDNDEIIVPASSSVTRSISAMDAPGAGSATYSLKAKVHTDAGYGADIAASNRRMQLTESLGK